MGPTPSPRSTLAYGQTDRQTDKQTGTFQPVQTEQYKKPEATGCLFKRAKQAYTNRERERKMVNQNVQTKTFHFSNSI